MSEDRVSQVQLEFKETRSEVEPANQEISEKENKPQITEFTINYDEKIEELKNEVKALKILRKQQEKIEKLEEKKKEILREMEIKDGHKKRGKDKKRKRKGDRRGYNE